MSTSSYHSACLPVVGSRGPQSDSRDLRSALETDFEMVGDGQAMARLRLQVRRIGPHFRTVLVSGEAGTGKELVARALHRASPGASGPFIMCHASTRENGHSISSETIDFLTKRGQRGTLFLDGIGQMPLEMQAHLVGVLRRWDSVGEGLAAPQKVDIRIIASTAEDLQILMAAGRFRQELHQRIAMLEITVPPLRERTEDIPGLTMHFVNRFGRLYGKIVDGIAEEVMERLEGYRWPGNVRELEDVLWNGVLQCEGKALKVEHLPELAQSTKDTGEMMRTARLQDVVEKHVLQVLRSCAGNKVRAAELLGISRSTLYRMLEACASSTMDVTR